MFFSEEDHKYYKKNKGDFKYISASAVAEHFTEPFDGDYWSLYKAYEFLIYSTLKDKSLTLDKYLEKDEKIMKECKKFFKGYRRGYAFGDYKLFDHLRMYGDENKAAVIKDKIKEAWYTKNVKSQIKGSKYHERREDKDHFEGEVANPWTGELQRVKQCTQWVDEGVKTNIIPLEELPDGYYTELIVYHNFLIGQIDRLWISGRYFYISDYKTNERLDFENRFKKMLGPCKLLDDCNFNHYTIQLGIYCYIMENLGYTYGGSSIVHCIQDEETGKWDEKTYPLNYDRDFIHDIVSYIWFDLMM